MWTFERQKCGHLSEMKYNPFSGLTVYLCIDAPSFSQNKDCSVHLGVNLCLLTPAHHAEVEVGLEQDMILIIQHWSLFNSRAFSVCSYSGSRWFGFGASSGNMPIFRVPSSLYRYSSQIILFWPLFVSTTEIFICLAEIHSSDWLNWPKYLGQWLNMFTMYLPPRGNFVDHIFLEQGFCNMLALWQW